MLKRILSILDRGETRSIADLARHLEVSHDVLDQMLAQLESLGYLCAAGGECEVACSGCSLSSSCPAQGSGRLWALTERGSQVIAQEN